MALPPTGLTLLLDQATTPEAAYEALRRAGCLSAEGRAERAHVIAMLAASEDRSHDSALGPPRSGPTATDRAAAALMASSYLSARGRRSQKGGKQPSRAWWQLWT